ncbi:TRAP transporter TAXI family solute receptor [Nocardia sp. GAS34]
MRAVNRSAGIGRRTFLTLTAGAVSGAIGVPFTTPERDPDPFPIRIAIGSMGPTRMFRDVLVAAAAGSGVRIQEVPSLGAMDNLHLLTGRRVDAALVMADAVTPDITRCRAVGNLYEAYTQVVVRPDSPVRHLADLRGARIMLGAKGSGASLTGMRILQAAGLRPGDDSRVSYLPLENSVAALRDRSVDAVVWLGGIPTPELEISRTTRLLDLDDVTAPLRRRYPSFYDRVQISQDIYQLPAQYHTIGVSVLLVVDPHLPDAAAESLTDLLLRHSHQLVDGSAGSQFMDDGSLIDTWPVRLHPGAIRAYRRAHR